MRCFVVLAVVAVSVCAQVAVRPMVVHGQEHCLMLQSDGTVWSWGQNNYGQLGLGHTTFASVPQRIASLSNVIQLSAAVRTSYALKRDGTVWAWGDGSYGVSGLCGVSVASTPTQIPGLSSIVAISAGREHAMALTSAGTVYGWGRNEYGNLGNGGVGGSCTPTLASNLTGVVDVKCGDHASYVIRANNKISACGYNSDGRLGLGDWSPRYTFTEIVGLTDVRVLDVNWGTTYAIRGNGDLWAWGHNGYGGVGNGLSTNINTPTLVAASVRNVTAFGFSVVAETLDGSFMTWGYNGSGQLGLGNTSDRWQPTLVSSTTNWREVSRGWGQYFSYVIHDDGSVHSCGSNPYGALGYGRNSGDTTRFQHVPALSAPGIVISGGDVHGAARRPDGTVCTFGANDYGQLGTGNTSGQVNPYTLSGTWAQVECGMTHTLLLDNNGVVHGMGSNASGELGLGYFGANHTTAQPQPATFWNLPQFVEIQAGDHCSFARAVDGTVWSWGSNSYGVLGVGMTGGVSTAPIMVPGITNAVSISCAYYTVAVLMANGTVKTWGRNDWGNLGNGTAGTSSHSSVPVNFGTVNTAVAIADSGAQTWAVLANGQVMAAGNAISSNPSNMSPGSFQALRTARGAWNYAFAIDAAGALRCIGEDDYGQRGLGNTNGGWSWQTPPCLEQHPVASVSCMADTTFITHTCGQTYVTGKNNAGQWGTGWGGGDPGPGLTFHTVLESTCAQPLRLDAPLTTTLGSIPYSLSTQPARPGATYWCDVSLEGNAPGIILPGLGRIPLAGLWLHATFGPVAPDVFESFVGPLDLAGTAQPQLHVPLWPEFVGRDVFATALVFDPAGPLGLGAIANGTTTRLTMPVPAITSVSPSSGSSAGGDSVAITGTNFVPGLSVSFGGVPATAVSVGSSQLITCTAPPHVMGTVDVQVTNTGMAPAVALGAFTYLPSGSAPQLTGVTPSDAPIAGGTAITLLGSGFQSGAVVRFGSTPATNVVVALTGDSLTCTAPAASVGPVGIEVVNPDLQTVALTGAFTYLPNLWVLIVNPGAPAPGETVSVLGAGFQSGIVVSQGATVIPATVQSQGLLSFVTPAGLTCGAPLTFLNPSGQSATFAFNTAPTLTSIVPAAGPMAGGNTVLLTGTGFGAATTVTVGGTPATVLLATSTALQIVMPPGATGAQPVLISAANLCTVSGSYTFN